MTVSILILAAGASSRMQGRDKLMEMIDGKPLLRRVAERALQASDDVVVTLPQSSDRGGVLTGLAIRPVEVENADLGMSASISAGARAFKGLSDGIMILPSDMPDITADDLRAVIQNFELNKTITRGCTDNLSPGHPVIFPRDTFAALTELTGDQGAKSLLTGKRVQLVPLPGNNAVTDLDTAKDWEIWRAGQAASKRAGK